ncbi:MAG: LPS export ABC transporter periplasmic protein LptC [Opitutaceae bacterium]|nr:LPS export ABC transporter periplasmic protein LptC [Opitutaceae bacterium]
MSLALFIGLLAPVLAATSPLTTQTPVKNFRLPTYNEAGHRSMLIQGARAIVGADQIELTDLNLTLFTGDKAGTIETIILSPQAIAEPKSERIHGEHAVRFIRNDLEITGERWTYNHHEKKVSIATKTRITFHVPLPDILK